MIYIEWCRNENQMKVIGDDDIWYADCSCVVRNELNGYRPNKDKKPSSEIVHAIRKNNTVSDFIVMPRQFPKGKWNVTSVEPRKDKYRKPYIILTDAFQELEIWDTDPDGGYLKGSELYVRDYQYGIHFSESRTTQGCIKLENRDDILRLSVECLKSLACGEVPVIEVV